MNKKISQNLGAEDIGWLVLIEAHLQRYPALAVQDVYKLLYQGILGPEHILPSADIFTTRLEAELAALDARPGALLLESIRPDESLLRIHLRPWLALEQSVGALVGACLETGRQAWGTPANLLSIWRFFLEQLAAGRFPALSLSEAETLDALLAEKNYPPLHHSPAYTENYHPAYRLVSIDQARAAGWQR